MSLRGDRRDPGGKTVVKCDLCGGKETLSCVGACHVDALYQEDVQSIAGIGGLLFIQGGPFQPQKVTICDTVDALKRSDCHSIQLAIYLQSTNEVEHDQQYILNMYHLLTDVYHARVEKVAAQPAKGEQRTLIITLTIDGQPEVYNLKSEDYELLLIKLARKDFNEPFTRSEHQWPCCKISLTRTPSWWPAGSG